MRDLYLLVSKKKDRLRHVLLMVQVWTNLGIKSTIDVEHHMIKVPHPFTHPSAMTPEWLQPTAERFVGSIV